MDKPSAELRRLIKFTREFTYYCPYCGRDLIAEYGAFVHDDVYHPADWTTDGGGVMEEKNEVEVDQYGNPIDGSSMPFCAFPDCGCAGARNCMAKSGANMASLNFNIEQGQRNHLGELIIRKGK